MITRERVEVATVNVHAFATLGSVHDLASLMHTLSLFPDVFVTLEDAAPGVLRYVVDVETVEVEP